MAEPENVIPLKTMNDESLAIIYVEKDSMHVLPDESKSFSVNTPPFGHFLVERVLAKMQEKDNELVRMGQLTPDKMFAYNIVREGDLIREIVIRNVDEERLRELKSSIRWTLEKMYEKTKSLTPKLLQVFLKQCLYVLFWAETHESFNLTAVLEYQQCGYAEDLEAFGCVWVFVNVKFAHENFPSVFLG